jgi:hypothetical protein
VGLHREAVAAAEGEARGEDKKIKKKMEIQKKNYF